MGRSLRLARAWSALAVALLGFMLSPAVGGAERCGIVVGDDGRLAVRTPGKGDITAYVTAAYDGRSYGVAEPPTAVAEGRWQGVIEKKPEDGAGRVEFTQTQEDVQDGVRFAFRFRKHGGFELRPAHIYRGVQLCFTVPLPDFAGRRVVLTHGMPGLRADRSFDVPCRGFTLDLTDDEAIQVWADRASVVNTNVWDGAAIFRIRLSPLDFEEEAEGAVTLRIVPAAAPEAPWTSPPHNGALRVGRVVADRETVPRYGTVELTFDLSARYDNPFDPGQVAVEAEFTTPSGRVERLPGFWYEGFEAEYENGEELLSRGDEQCWKVRYTPREVGGHSVTVRARDASGEAASGPLRFRCVESDEGGFVRIAQGRDGPLYLQLDDGKGLFLIGHNVTGYSGRLDEVFRKMADGGENYTRMWMSRWGLGLEWDLPVGRYRMDRAWQVDRLLALARDHGIHIMLCFDTHQDFRQSWLIEGTHAGAPGNPYNSACGGPCETPMDFFSNDEAKALYRNRLRYIIARWGHHPNVLCWEFANELEGWPGAQQNRETVAAWHVEMARYLRENDPFGHPVTSSLWTTEGWPELWNLPGMEIVQSHFYASQHGGYRSDMAAQVEAICRQKLRDYPGKPHVFGEYGIGAGSGDQTRRDDPTGVHLHKGNWAALMSGCASVPVSWWHGNYIDPMDLYRVYRGIARYVEGEDLAARAWRPIQVTSVANAEATEVRYGNLEFSGPASGWAGAPPEGIRFVVGRDGTVENVERLPGLLHGTGHEDLRGPLTFETDGLKPFRFDVRVGRVSAGAVLKSELDGRTVSTVELPAAEGLGEESVWQEQWRIWQTRYDRDFGIDVPAGRHTITLSNDGRDWVEVAFYRLEGYLTTERPNLRVLGMAADDRVLLWAGNKAHTWFNVHGGGLIPPVAPSVVTLAGLRDGPWRVEHWDTVEGKVTGVREVVVKDGQLELHLPEIQGDLALKLAR